MPIHPDAVLLPLEAEFTKSFAERLAVSEIPVDLSIAIVDDDIDQIQFFAHVFLLISLS
jgi:hypothetical protein